MAHQLFHTTYIEISDTVELGIDWYVRQWYDGYGYDREAELACDYADVYVRGRTVKHYVPLARITDAKLRRWADTSWAALETRALENAEEA